MRFLSRSLMAVFLLSVTLAVLSLAAFVVLDAVAERRAAPTPQRPAQERVPAVRVVTLAPGRETPVIDGFGEVHARRSLELRAPAAGRVQQVAATLHDGAQVAQGALLLRIDPADATTARDLAAADLARAEDELREARAAVGLAREDVAGARLQAELRERALARQSDLATRGVGATAATEEAEIALATARQSVVARRQALASAEGRAAQAETALARQRIALAEAERRLEETALHAPFDGRLSDVAVVAGGLVAMNERLATLIDPSALEVRFRLSAGQAARLMGAGGAVWPAPVTVTLDLDGVALEARGRLDRADPAVGEGQAGRMLHAALEDGAGLIPGDFVRVAVQEPALQDAARLPARAVDAAGRVLVVAEDGRLREAEVRVLRRQGDSVLVSAPDLAGAAVVAARSAMVGAGLRVRPVPQDAAGAPIGPGAGRDGASGDTGGAGDPDDRLAVGAMVTLDADRRAALIAAVTARGDLSDGARARMIERLRAERVPAALVARIEGAGAPRSDG